MKIYENNGQIRHQKTVDRIANVAHQSREAFNHLLDSGCDHTEVRAVANDFIHEILTQLTLALVYKRKQRRH